MPYSLFLNKEMDKTTFSSIKNTNFVDLNNSIHYVIHHFLRHHHSQLVGAEFA